MLVVSVNTMLTSMRIINTFTVCLWVVCPSDCFPVIIITQKHLNRFDKTMQPFGATKLRMAFPKG